MSADPIQGRDCAPAEGSYAGPYAKPTRGGSRRPLRIGQGPTWFDRNPSITPPPDGVPPLPSGGDWATVPPPLGAPILILRADGLDFQVDPVEPEPGASRMWRIWYPGVEAVHVAELEDPEGPGAGEGDLRGLWCSCGTFAEKRDCGHLRDGVAVGLLRPDRSEWEDCPMAEDCPLALSLTKGGAR